MKLHPTVWWARFHCPPHWRNFTQCCRWPHRFPCPLDGGPFQGNFWNSAYFELLPGTSIPVRLPYMNCDLLSSSLPPILVLLQFRKDLLSSKLGISVDSLCLKKLLILFYYFTLIYAQISYHWLQHLDILDPLPSRLWVYASGLSVPILNWLCASGFMELGGNHTQDDPSHALLHLPSTLRKLTARVVDLVCGGSPSCEISPKYTK